MPWFAFRPCVAHCKSVYSQVQTLGDLILLLGKLELRLGSATLAVPNIKKAIMIALRLSVASVVPAFCSLLSWLRRLLRLQHFYCCSTFRTFEIGTPAREVTRAWDIMDHVELLGGMLQLRRIWELHEGLRMMRCCSNKKGITRGNLRKHEILASLGFRS